jgi:hypothetical protein
MGAMKDLLMSRQYADVVEKYLQGDSNAIYLIDTAIGATLDMRLTNRRRPKTIGVIRLPRRTRRN